MCHSLIALALLANYQPLLDATDDNEIILVTTRHWQEPVVDVPATTEIFNVESRLANLSRLDQQLTNVKIEASSVQTRVSIRGNLGYDSSLQQPIGFYVDNVALPLGGSQLPVLYNIAPVEVYKGPFGDLYGRHSEGGLIKVTSLAPTWETEGSYHFSSGVTDGANGHQPSSVIGLSVTTPLIKDQLATVMSLRYEKAQGTQVNQYNNEDDAGDLESIAGSIGFDIFLGTATEVTWRSHLSRQDSGKAGLRYLTGAAATPRYTINYDTQTFDNKDSDIHSLTLVNTQDDFTITATTGYTRYSNHFNADLDLTAYPVPATLMALKDDMLSQEIRLSSIEDTKTSSSRWTLGVYLYDQDTDSDFTIGGSAMLARAQRITQITQQGQAIFGQIDWQVGANWTANLGMRYERVNKRGEQEFNSTQSANYQVSIDNSMWLPKASIHYQLDKDQNVYFAIASGYVPGGYNHTFAQNAASFTFDKETSINVELGYKAYLLNNQLLLTTAVFSSETQDKQIVDIQPGFITAISNAAKTSAKGAELNLNYQYSDNVSSFLHLGVMHATADEYLVTSYNGTGFVTNDLNGNRLTLSPDISYSLGVNYQTQSGWFGQLVVSGSGKYYFDAANQLPQSAYTVVDANIGYAFENIRLSLSIDNLTDEEIYSRSVSTSSGIVVEDTRARYLGLNLTGNW